MTMRIDPLNSVALKPGELDEVYGPRTTKEPDGTAHGRRVKAEPPVEAQELSEDSAKVEALAALAGKAAAKKKDVVPGPSTKSPLHVAIKKSLFKHALSQAIGEVTVHGYQHKDNRAALVAVTPDGIETWTVRWPDSHEESGREVAGLEKILLITPAKRAHAAARVERRVSADKAKASALATQQLAEAEADGNGSAVPRPKPIGQVLPGGPADHVCRAIEMLGTATAGQYDFDMLKGEKRYGARVALLRALFNRGISDFKVAETGVKNLEAAFYSATGIPLTGGSKTMRTKAFAARCVEIVKAFLKARRDAGKAEKKAKDAAWRIDRLNWTVPGDIIMMPPKRSKKELAAEAKAAAVEFSTPRTLAKPDAGAVMPWAIDVRHMRLVAFKSGASGLRLEAPNSQGALQVLDNGKRVVASVLTPTLARGKDVSVGEASLEVLSSALGLLTQSKSEHATGVDDLLTVATLAIDIAHDPLRLRPTDTAVAEPRQGAEEPLSYASARLLEDRLLGPVLLRLERAGSQGALCVYNDGSKVSVGVVPIGVLTNLRPVTCDIATAAQQILEPVVPSVPVTPVAARHLTAVIEHRKEIEDMAGKKFEAKGAEKRVVKAKKSAVKKTAGEPRKSSLFRLVKATEKVWGAFDKQKGEIVAAFKKLGAVGSKASGITRAQLITAAPKVPVNNLSFYLSKWQPAGILEKLEAK